MVTYKTTEWVSPGHPDKVADYISEYILDRLIEKDPRTRYALEVQIKDNHVSLAGEITSSAEWEADNLKKWTREAINEIGYTEAYAKRFKEGSTIWGNSVDVDVYVSHQSQDIAQGVNKDAWGDQGIFFGYFCRETANGEGIDQYLARKLGEELYHAALYNTDTVGIDIKTQVTVAIDTDGGYDVKEVIVAIPCNPEKITEKQLKAFVKKKIEAHIPEAKSAKLIVNGTGAYQIHGPVGDSGTTGRKLVVDFYGSRSRIGGGCVDSETEYLSENGWKKISEYNGGRVGQLNDNLELEMVKPERYINTYHDDVYEISTEKTTNMVLSGNHNVLYRTSKGHLQKKPLSQIIEESEKTKKGSHIDIPMTFYYGFENGKLCDYGDKWSRIVVAHCADGTVLKKCSNNWNCRIRVKKQHKIDRLRMLFSKFPDMYEERKYSDGYTYFYYCLENTSKLLCEQFRKPDMETAQMLSEEVYKWDGSEKYKEYRTTRKEDADFIQFVLSGVTGKAHSICVHKKKDGYKECYVVRETKKNHSNPFRKIGKNKIEKKEPQKMYCFTVPSGKLLLRRNGYIFCTANSPWTKDGSKADLTLNIFAYDMARNVYNDLKEQINGVHHVETELSCCIGKQDVRMFVTAYDENNVPVYEAVEEEKIKPSILIKTYGLDKPNYADLCRYGLFSCVKGGNK